MGVLYPLSEADASQKRTNLGFSVCRHRPSLTTINQRCTSIYKGPRPGPAAENAGLGTGAIPPRPPGRHVRRPGARPSRVRLNALSQALCTVSAPACEIPLRRTGHGRRRSICPQWQISESRISTFMLAQPGKRSGTERAHRPHGARQPL